MEKPREVYFKFNAKRRPIEWGLSGEFKPDERVEFIERKAYDELVRRSESLIREQKLAHTKAKKWKERRDHVTKERDELVRALERANQKLRDINEMFYGQGYSVAGWHQNGSLEPIDNFFEENDWTTEELAVVDSSARKETK